MEKLIIDWSAQDSGRLSISFQDLGFTKKEFEKMRESEKMSVIQKALDDLPEQVNKFADNYWVG